MSTEELIRTGTPRVSLEDASRVLSEDMIKRHKKAAASEVETKLYQRKLDCLRKYHLSPVLGRIKTGESDLLQEIGMFYDLSLKNGLNDGWGSVERNKILLEDVGKFGASPEDLVGIIGGLTEEEFDSSLLEYCSVREIYSKQISNNNSERRTLRDALTCSLSLTPAALLVGLPESTSLALLHSLLPLVAVSLGGLLYSGEEIIRTSIKGNKIESNKHFEELERLYLGAFRSDGFVEDAYKNPITKAYLESGMSI